MLAVRRKVADSEVFVIDYIEFDKDSIKRARDEFAKFKEKGVILNPFFEDNTWVVTNQETVTRLIFDFSEVEFRKQISKYNREMGTYTDFVDAFKSFCVFKLNEYSLLTLKQFHTSTKKEVKNTSFFNPQEAGKSLFLSPKTTQTTRNLFLEFLEFYPFPDTEEFIEGLQLDQVLIDENTESGEDMNRRRLAEFQSYFYFDKLLDQFWKFSASDNDKLYFYPLYLFWKITNILPMRVTEFTVTPRNCLKPDDEGNYRLIIRRSALKGSKKGKNVQHNIEDDYTLHDYPISNDVAEMIMDYKQRTEQYESSGFLLSWEAFQAASVHKHRNLRIAPTIGKTTLTKRINSVKLARLLTVFYKEILQDRMNLRILYKAHHRTSDDKPKVDSEDEPLKPMEIMKYALGDTRHFALINMVLNGVSPIIIKDFAGHNSINQSYHYFGHIDKFVKCIAYDKFQEIRKNVISDEEVSPSQELTLGNIQLQLNRKGQPFKEVDGGKCFSSKFLKNDITDCIKAPTSGIIGDCFNCEFFASHSKEYNELLKKRKFDLEKKMNDDGNYLLRVITNYKNTFKDEEVMTRTLLNIQQKAHQYLKMEEKLHQTEGFK